MTIIVCFCQCVLNDNNLKGNNPMQTLSQASMTNRLKMQASEIGFDNHYKHPLMMAFNLKVSQASYPIILKQVPI